MTGAVELRGYRHGDLQAMFEMDVLCFAEPFRFDLRSMRRFAEARNAIVALAEEAAENSGARRLLGFVIVHVGAAHDGIRGYVVTLDVLPEARRMGIARRLMVEIEGRAADAGAKEIDLHVFSGNAAAIQFYEREGYLRVGMQRGFYEATEEISLDALVYRKWIGAV